MQRTIIGTYCFNMQMNTILILMATNQAKKRTSTWNEQFSGTLNCIISLQKAFPLTHQIGTFELDLQYFQTFEKPNLKSKISLSLFLNDAWFKFSSIKNSALSYWCGKPKKFLGLALKKKKIIFFLPLLPKLHQNHATYICQKWNFMGSELVSCVKELLFKSITLYSSSNCKQSAE